jgi:outer membrane protein assembly factor BamB
MRRIGLLAGAALLALGACSDDVILTGERGDLRGETAAANRPQPISLPAQSATGEWTHKAAGPDHDMPHGALSAAPRLAFAVDIGEGEDRRHRITADPVVSGGRVFTVDSRARVMAHSVSGQALWSANVSPAGEPVDDASGAGLAVSGDRLYVSTAFGQVIALDTGTGRRIWAQDIGAAAAGAPTVEGGRVYVVGRDATAWALDAGTGRIDWTEQGTPDASGVTGGASPAVSGDRIVLPFSSRELRGVLPGGTELWTTTVAGTRLGRVYAAITDITGDPVIDGGTVYAGSPSGRINAVSLASGEQLWTAEEGAMSPVVVAGGSVFAVTDQAQLVRLDATTGEPVWRVDLPYFKRALVRRRQSVFAHYGPVLAGGRLWVASSDGWLRAFDPASGTRVGEVELPPGAATNAAVAGQTLYVVSTDGRLLAFR